MRGADEEAASPGAPGLAGDDTTRQHAGAGDGASTASPEADVADRPARAGADPSARPGAGSDQNDAAIAVDLRGVSKRYGSAGQIPAVEDMTFGFPAGTSTAVLGPSGSGKTTLLLLASGLLRPDDGTVSLLGHDTSSGPDRVLSRLRLQSVGFVFQFFNLIRALPCWQNVALPRVMAGASSRSSRERAVELLVAVGLEGYADRYPDELSGGEMQRVAIARAMVNEPEVVFADEPTGNLDSQAAARVRDLLLDLHQQSGSTLVVVTHDQETAAMCARRVSLRDGRIVDGDG